MWKEYFGGGAQITGSIVKPEWLCGTLVKRFDVIIGSQSDEEGPIGDRRKKYRGLDILFDDVRHRNADIRGLIRFPLRPKFI